MRYLMALSIGIFSVAWWPRLPESAIGIGFILFLSLGWFFIFRLSSKVGCIGLCLGLGICWALLSAGWQQQHQLPTSLDKRDFVVTGTINSLVDTNDRRSRFRFVVDSALLLSDPSESVPLRSLLLSWYSFPSVGTKLISGDRWTLIVRLRQPRGLRNPGAFDYQSWLQQQSYSATGYIRQANTARRLQSSRQSIHHYRSQIRQAINSSGLSELGSAVVVALSIGDKKQISAYWDDLARLGIVHLLVISGLHIGLIAAMAFFFGKLFGRLLLPLYRWFPLLVSTVARCSGPVLAIVAALLYSLLAGFSLPTQRALIAVVVVMFSKLISRHVQPFTCIAWALLLIAITQPLAILSAGFWLSFVAVGVLLWWFTPWLSATSGLSLRPILSAQLALLVAMMIPLLIFIGRASWLAPLINLVAVPWISFISVPLSLLGAAIHIPWPEAAVLLWQLADHSISALWTVIDWLPGTVGYMYAPMPFDRWGTVAALLAVLGLLLPRALPGRWLCLLPLLTVLLAAKSQAPLRLSILDVGQGLAVVVETDDKTLVYDAGPIYGERFSAGSGIIAPYLWRRGRNRIDLLIVSHEDGDHSGGVKSLLKSVQVDELLVGHGVSLDGGQHCLAGQSRHWGQGIDLITFQLLSPSPAGAVEGNNSSCVLLITWRNQTILLPGDIEQQVEQQLPLASALITVLIAPHHGSKTSSTVEFVALTRPAHVVFSSGYRHQFGHPHSSVVKRYGLVASRLWQTSEQGAISFVWNQQAELVVEPTRSVIPDHWWR
jgi:competence protein ComEC